MPPTISGYVIAKDEEATIERTLQSLRGVCGEVIAGVDDASTDRTESICHEYADQVVRFTWSDDFSAARNQVVDACTGDWIVHLDGHEHFAVQQQPHPDAVFVLGEEAARMVRETIHRTDRERPDMKVLGCAVKIHCDENLIAQIVSVQERIFRKGLQYRNPVHNVLTGYDPHEALGYLDILILHDRPPDREKARTEQRNEMLPRRMQERVDHDPDDLRSWSYLQRHAMVMNDWAEVVRSGEAYAANARRLKRDTGDEYYHVNLHCAIACRLLYPPDFERAEAYLQTCMRLSHFKREHWLEYSALHAARHDWRRQETCLRVASILPFDGRNSKGTFDERIYTYIPHQILSELYEGLGMLPEAIEEAHRVKRYRPRTAVSVERLARLESLLREREADLARKSVCRQSEVGPIRWIRPQNALGEAV